MKRSLIIVLCFLMLFSQGVWADEVNADNNDNGLSVKVENMEKIYSSHAVRIDENTYFIPIDIDNKIVFDNNQEDVFSSPMANDDMIDVIVGPGDETFEVQGILTQRFSVADGYGVWCYIDIDLNVIMEFTYETDGRVTTETAKFIKVLGHSVSIGGDNGFSWDPGTSDLGTATILDDGKKLKYYTKGNANYSVSYSKSLDVNLEALGFSLGGVTYAEGTNVTYRSPQFISFTLKANDCIEAINF